MALIEIRPATAEGFDDVEHAFSGGGDGRSCQCVWWLMRAKDFSDSTREQRERMLETEIRTGPPPGLIAYVDGDAAGWVRVGPRVRQPRIMRTRAIAAATPFAADDESVWAVSCFVIRREHRRQGLQRALLDAAVAYARERGARAVEAYPTDTAVSDARANELYRGVLSVYLDAGFEEVARTHTDRALVRLDLTRAAAEALA